MLLVNLTINYYFSKMFNFTELFRKHPVRGNGQSPPVRFTNAYFINLTSALMRTQAY